MPAFPNVDTATTTALLDYLRTGGSAGQGGAGSGDKKEMASAPTAAALPLPVADPRGAAVYEKRCAVCHGEHMEGNPPSFPMLLGLSARLSATQTTDLIHAGKGRMPAQPQIQGSDLEALLRYLGVTGKPVTPAAAPMDEAGPYIFTGYRKFLDPDGYPAFIPPWGTLSAIDLKTGKYLWKVPLGEYPALAAQGMKDTGSENYGGPVVTKGGILFIGATVYDRRFRVFDTSTGKLLWETELPFAGMATPSTYMIDGRQYVVIACSGGRDPKSPVGGEYVAFALPGAK
jgi:quinoprotein glucose dehydrogenase